MNRWLGERVAAVGVFLGLSAGVGAFTFVYAQGFSYFSSEPAACANCHIMNDQYASWQRGPHHGAAGCVDCHLPHEGIAKLMAKGSNGYHHSRGFTFQDFHEPIMIKAGNSRILQDNCLRCHGDFLHEIVPGSSTDANAVNCIHCHRSVGHGAKGVWSAAMVGQDETVNAKGSR